MEKGVRLEIQVCLSGHKLLVIGLCWQKLVFILWAPRHPKTQVMVAYYEI